MLMSPCENVTVKIKINVIYIIVHRFELYILVENNYVIKYSSIHTKFDPERAKFY